jgi:hypothetical protein
MFGWVKPCVATSFSLFSDDILKQTVYLSKHASIEHHPLSKRIFLHQTRHFVLEHLLSFVCVCV